MGGSMTPADRASLAVQAWLHMRSCPRYANCSVPICPLDREWDLRSHDPAEAVCPYLRESAKPGIASRYVGRPDEHCLAAAIKLRPAIENRHPAIARRITESLDNPSLIDQAEASAARLQAGRAQKTKGRAGTAPCGTGESAAPGRRTP